ncbi:MAG TPA: pitrilysin family protein, partial [Candidatus Rubrimentiphilum sp.]|nr:pitrilysin family protein [Candidatus Rubrimentiphilum sp.]
MKRALLALALCASAVVAPMHCLAQGNPVETRLPNGLQLIVVPDKLAPVVTTVLTYHVGSNDDTKPGIAHATEHMMFRSMSGLSAAQLGDLAARMGGDYNAETTNEFTQFYFVAPRQYLPLILHIEALRMNGAYIAPAEWANERGAIEQEVRGRESNPYFAVGNELRQAMLGGTPYATDALGTVESFQRMTADDIRAFYRTWYHPNNATLVITGDVNAADVARQVNAMFGAIPAAQLPAHPAIALPPLRPVTLERTMNVPAPSVALAFRYPSVTSPDFAASLVLYIALENPRGPLTQLNLSGKVSGARFSLTQYLHAGFADLSASVSPTGNGTQTEAALDTYLQSILRDGVSPEFIAIAKQRLLTGRVSQLAAISGLAQLWASAVNQGRTPQDVYDAIAQVTPADVDRVLRTYIRPAADVAVIIQAAAAQKNVATQAPPLTGERFFSET